MGWAFFIITSSFTWDNFHHLCSIFSLTKWEKMPGFVTKLFYGLWLKVHANREFNILKAIARGLFWSELLIPQYPLQWQLPVSSSEQVF